MCLAPMFIKHRDFPMPPSLFSFSPSVVFQRTNADGSCVCVCVAHTPWHGTCITWTDTVIPTKRQVILPNIIFSNHTHYLCFVLRIWICVALTLDTLGEWVTVSGYVYRWWAVGYTSIEAIASSTSIIIIFLFVRLFETIIMVSNGSYIVGSSAFVSTTERERERNVDTFIHCFQRKERWYTWHAVAYII